MKVMKFGGSSLSTEENRKSVIDLIKKNKSEKLVVVVSAMGRYPDAYATETLRNLISTKVTIEETSRVLSVGEIISSVVLTNELLNEGINALSLSSVQAALIVENNELTNIDKDRIEYLFKDYDVLILPGFQGVNKEDELCILEAGDSDYSAVYIAKELGCKEVFIYSDVCGIYTADPKHVISAKLIDRISYKQAKDLAKHKARIICYKALLEAEKSNDFIIYLASTFIDYIGTKIDHNDSFIRTMSIDFDYELIHFEETILEDDFIYLFESLNDDYFVKKEDLVHLKTQYTKIAQYTKVHFVGCDLEDDEIYTNLVQSFCIKSNVEMNSYYINNKTQKQDILKLHDILVRGD